MTMTISGIKLKQRDIVLVLFPFSDLSAAKHRPALVMSNNDYNSTSEDIICCAITSNPDERPYTVGIHNCDLDEGVLPKPSKVKATAINFLHKSLIKEHLGRLNLSKCLQVQECLFSEINIES